MKMDFVCSHMEFYADEMARGGVLEPEGTVAIKFRKKDLIKTMKRLDAKYKELLQKLGEILMIFICWTLPIILWYFDVDNENLSPGEKKEIEKEVAQREEELMPLYHQVAVHFADLHDTPGVMMQSGCISVSRDYMQSQISSRYKIPSFFSLNPQLFRARSNYN